MSGNAEAKICSPTTMLKDIDKLEKLIDMMRKAGTTLPPALEASWQLVKTGKNVEDAMNSVCSELGRMLSSSQEYCARNSGFTSYDDMSKSGDWQQKDKYDICMLQNYYKTEANERVKSVLYVGNKKSFISTLSESTRQQLWEIISRWIKRRVKKLSSPPPYENPKPRLP